MDRTKMVARENGRVCSWALALVATVVVFSAALASPAFAAQTDITISTAAAPATPRILGAAVVGAVPGSPFLFTVPATGQAPLKFEATGLPTGLAIDATSGTITGTAPGAGTYAINLTVSNGSGSASRTLTLNAGTTLALTPPMGWNSYDSFGGGVTEDQTLAAAQAMKTTLAPFGWDTIVIDFHWYNSSEGDPSTARFDANGRFLPALNRFPSATGDLGYKPLADKIHAMGLKFGIHLMRGIPRATFNADKAITDSTYTAKQAGNSSDTCSWDTNMYGVKGDTPAGQAWYDSIYKQYAAWGVDFVKVDDMMNPYGGNVLHTTEVVAVHNSIVKTGRSMILSLSPGPTQTKDVTTLNANANMWRQVNDFWDNASALSSMSNEFDATYAWSTTTGITPGHWPDADMLPLGTIGSRPCAFSHNQQVQVMTLWAIMPSPLIFGGMPTKLSTDSWTLALLTNDEVLAVNQDSLGAQGKRISQQGTSEVWAKNLADGRKAVALLNRAAQDATIAVTFAQLGVTGTPAVRDLWNRKDVTDMTSGLSVNVPHDSALMYVVGTPAAPGTGGSSGAGGGPGGAGGGSSATGKGGAGGSAGATGAGGTTGSGGTAGATGGAAAGGASAAGGAASGGSVGRGGSAGGGTIGTGGTSSANQGGAGGNTTHGAGGASSGSSGQKTTSSGCSFAPDRSHSASFLWSGVALLLAVGLRRRKLRSLASPGRG
jgi:alpha-galactosidase